MTDYTFTRDSKGEITGVIVPSGRPFKVIFTTKGLHALEQQKPRKTKKPRINPNPEKYSKTEHWNIAKQIFADKPVLSYDSLILALSRRYKVGLTKVKIKGGYFELLKTYGYIVRKSKGFYSLCVIRETGDAKQVNNK